MRRNTGVDIKILISLLHFHVDRLASFGPYSAYRGLQTKAPFIKEKKQMIRVVQKGFSLYREFFLKASWAFMSAFAWTGRGFFNTKSIFLRCFHKGVVPMVTLNSFSISFFNFFNVQCTGSPRTFLPLTIHCSMSFLWSSVSLDLMCPLGRSLNPSTPSSLNFVTHRKMLRAEIFNIFATFSTHWHLVFQHLHR